MRKAIAYGGGDINVKADYEHQERKLKIGVIDYLITNGYAELTVKHIGEGISRIELVVFNEPIVK